MKVAPRRKQIFPSVRETNWSIGRHCSKINFDKFSFNFTGICFVSPKTTRFVQIRNAFLKGSDRTRISAQSTRLYTAWSVKSRWPGFENVCRKTEGYSVWIKHKINLANICTKHSHSLVFTWIDASGTMFDRENVVRHSCPYETSIIAPCFIPVCGNKLNIPHTVQSAHVRLLKFPCYRHIFPYATRAHF